MPAKKADPPGKMRHGKAGSKANPPSPSWPLLKPLVPTMDLELQTLLQDQIVIIKRLFTAALCQKYVSFLDSLPLVTTPSLPKKGEAVRVNDRFQVEDPNFAEILFKSTGLEKLIHDAEYDWGGEVCGLNPRIRVYRYKQGMFFDKHYDDMNLVEMPSTPPIRTKTTWTLLLYLAGPTTGCRGGETVFYPDAEQLKPSTSQRCNGSEAIVVAPEAGMALLHKHGDDCLLHEGRIVTAGEKWVIRSDLCVKV